MRNIIFVVLLITLSQCKESSLKPKEFDGKTIVEIENSPLGISVQVINGCQYIYAETQRGVAIVHAANCNNIQH